jgi:hypothetical protein
MLNKLENLPKFRLVCSVHHTGTWFVIRFINRHPDTKNMGTPALKKVLDGRHGLKEDNTLHAHFLHGKEIIDLANKFNAVIPIRDPIASIITSKERVPKEDPFRIYTEFTRLLQVDKDKVFFLPVDLYKKKIYKVGLLRSLESFLNLTYNDNWVNEYAEQWKPINTQGVYKDKKKYLIEKDFNYTYHKYNKYIKVFQKNRKIKNFLKDLGYKDLLWWE